MTDFLRWGANSFARPLPVLVALLLLGVGLLWRRWWTSRRDADVVPSRTERGARLLLTLALLGLIVASLSPLPRALLGRLEEGYSAYSVQPGRDVRRIVVLCGGAVETPGHPALSALSAQTLERLAEGVRIARLHPAARILFTGGPPTGRTPCAELLTRAAAELGLDPERIDRASDPRTTEEEAVAVERVVGSEPFVLVTSAHHLRRASALMRARGLRPIPAPAGSKATVRDAGGFGILRLDAANLTALDIWTHEVLGMLWSRARGRI